jgi:hypothetical protein
MNGDGDFKHDTGILYDNYETGTSMVMSAFDQKGFGLLAHPQG